MTSNEVRNSIEDKKAQIRNLSSTYNLAIKQAEKDLIDLDKRLESVLNVEFERKVIKFENYLINASKCIYFYTSKDLILYRKIFYCKGHYMLVEWTSSSSSVTRITTKEFKIVNFSNDHLHKTQDVLFPKHLKWKSMTYKFIKTELDMIQTFFSKSLNTASLSNNDTINSEQFKKWMKILIENFLGTHLEKQHRNFKTARRYNI